MAVKKTLITAPSYDDLTTSDLVERYLIKGGETFWLDGSLAKSMRAGTICCCDEIVDAHGDDFHSYCIMIDKEEREYYHIYMVQQLIL